MRQQLKFLLPLLGITVPLAALAAPGALYPTGSSFSLGAEEFQDRYREADSLKLDEQTRYKSVTGYYSYSTPNNIFAVLDVRGSHGKDDYKSISGHLTGANQYEGEARARIGKSGPFYFGSLGFYVGFGARDFFDQGKGFFTEHTHIPAYDRHIIQYYIPIGASYKMNFSGLTVTPNVEYDPLISGKVLTHLSNTGAVNDCGVPYKNISNNQHSGEGFRGEVMFGYEQNGYGFEFGPFVRYWRFKDSDFTATGGTIGPLSCGAIEPKNDRLQAGGALRITF